MTLAVVPSFKEQFPTKASFEVVSWILAVSLLVICAQIVIPLPWTPVPVTGQTFGVGLMSLLWGKKRAGLQMATYLGMGFLGVPVFAAGVVGGLTFGPTFGYLIGMLLATQVIGALADRGWAYSFPKAVLALMAGSFVTLSCGWFWLSQMVGYEQALFSGVLPFLPGDAIKTLLAASFAVSAGKLRSEKPS